MLEPNKYYRFTYLSKTYAETGFIFLSFCKNIENDSDITNEKITLHRAYFFGSFFNLISSLEAFVNEMIGNLSGEIQAPTWVNIFGKYSDTIKIAYLNDPDIRNNRSVTVLDKFDKLLVWCDKPKFDKGSYIYQDLNAILKLRNEFIHYKPNWEMSKQGVSLNPHRIETILNSKKFKHNPFAKIDDNLFPNKLISSSVLEWTTESLKNYSTEFFKRISGS